jgi:GDP-4-dehydro-6-deoxy-D-mannose reductase
METERLRTLITGASGFLGSHVLTRLKESSLDEIIPLARTRTNQMEGCELCDYREVRELLSRTRPSKIFHCAGSFSNIFEQDYRNNVLATYHLLHGVNALELSCRVLLVGSASEYGAPESNSGCISENHPLNPVSVYGLSKAFQTEMMGYFMHKPDMDLVMARIFNLDGEGVSPLLFPGHVRVKIKSFLANEVETIDVGNLSAYRDYLSVDEAVSDMVTIMEHGKAGEVYNVGSGNPLQMMDYLKGLLGNHNIGMEAVKTDAGLETTSSEVSTVTADLSKLRALKAQVSRS